MADQQGNLQDRTTNFPIRIWKDDLQAFERLQKHLRLPREHLARMLWHLAIRRSPEVVAAAMRTALGPMDDDGDSIDPPPPSPDEPPTEDDD